MTDSATRGPTDHGRAMAALNEVVACLASGIGSDQVLDQVVFALRRRLRLRHCRVWIRSRSGESFDPVHDGEVIDSHDVPSWLERMPTAMDEVEGSIGFRLPLVTDAKPIGLLEAVTTHGDDPIGEVLRIVASVLSLWLASTELSEDLATEVALRTREIDAHRRFTAKIIDSLPVGLYVIDRGYRIQAWNRKRETGTQGIARQDAIGRPVFDVLSRQPADLIKGEFDNVFETGRIEQLDVVTTATGERRHFRISKIPMRLDDTEVTHVITIGEDVTEWKTIQQQISQTDKLAAIGQLAAGVMHELNNPLATIAACTEAVTGRVQNLPVMEAEAVEEYLRIIDSELERCGAIIGGLLDFSNPRAHAKQPESINQVVEDSLFLIKHHDRFHGIELVRDMSEGLPPVPANAKQLIQVFLALMLNAIDSMEGKGMLRVSTRMNPERKDEVLVAFSDTGLGIPREDFNKIFEPFFTSKATGRGSGLGLSICYGIVQEHRGRIDVDSQVGRGSTFEVFLPVADASARFSTGTP